MKVLSLFSGIGAFEKALDNLDVPYELVNFCEFDKYAVKSYCAIHSVDESKNLGDITKVDENTLAKDIDVLTYGFPCQDISLAGKQKGLFNEDGTQTRSGLFFEALRIIEATKPKIAIAENVKNLVGKKFNAQFQVVLASLEAAGYNNYWKVLNAKDFGVPQNRERVFIVSIRKDVDTDKFEFPKGFPLEKRLKDILEDAADEKYFLTETMTKRLFSTTYVQNKYENRVTKEGGVVGTLCARDYKDPKCVQLSQMHPTTVQKDNYVAVAMRGRYDEEGKIVQQVEVSDREYANAVTTVQKDSLVGVTAIVVDGSVKRSVAQNIEREKEQIAQSEKDIYQCECESGWQDNKIGLKTSPTVRANNNNNTFCLDNLLRIRKLTPKECFRLMGFDDESFHRAEAVNSNTQLYKQAGNSIVVDVLEHLFHKLIEANLI